MKPQSEQELAGQEVPDDAEDVTEKNGKGHPRCSSMEHMKPHEEN
jgi:hypothetical protein